jgi:hypothetical protein
MTAEVGQPRQPARGFRLPCPSPRPRDSDSDLRMQAEHWRQLWFNTQTLAY